MRSRAGTNVDEARPTAATLDYDQRSPFRPARQETLLTRAVPVAAVLSGYRGPSARRDAVAGVTAAALAIPFAMASAEVAGVSPVNGLYALLATIAISGLITSVLVEGVYWIDRRRRIGGAMSPAVVENRAVRG